MIVLIFGQDTFRSREKLREIIEYYKKKKGNLLNLIVFEGENLDYLTFKNTFESSSVFGERKLVVIKNISKNKNFKNFKTKFLKEIENFKRKKDVVLFFEQGILPKDSFFETLKKNSKFQEFKPLSFSQLKFWVKKEFLKQKREIEEKAILKLIQLVGNDLWRMENEIKKLICFKRKGEIKVKDVETLVPESKDIQIFEVIDAIFSKDKKKATIAVQDFFKKGEKIQNFLFLLKYQTRILLLFKDLLLRGEKKEKIIEKLNLHPFFGEKIFNLAKKFDLEILKEIYQRVFELDFNIKLGKDPESSLFLFLSRV